MYHRFIVRPFVRLLNRVVKFRFRGAQAICILDMQKLKRVKRCQYTGMNASYMYTVAIEKDGRFLKVQYRLGAHAIALLIVETSIELIIHPGNESKHVSVCLDMLKQSIQHVHAIRARHVNLAIEYISC